MWLVVFEEHLIKLAAQKAVKGWRNRSLAMGMRAWIEFFAEGLVKKAAEKAVKGWRQTGLARGWRAWLVVYEELLVQQKARVAVMKMPADCRLSETTSATTEPGRTLG